MIVNFKKLVKVHVSWPAWTSTINKTKKRKYNGIIKGKNAGFHKLLPYMRNEERGLRENVFFRQQVRAYSMSCLKIILQ